MHPLTVHHVFVHHGLSRLSDLDRNHQSADPAMEMIRPGELVHTDIKKLGRIPPGLGRRVNRRAWPLAPDT